MRFVTSAICAMGLLLLGAPAHACEQPQPDQELTDEQAQQRHVALTQGLADGEINRNFQTICEYAFVAAKAGKTTQAEELFLEAASLTQDLSKSLRAEMEAADMARDRGDYVRATQILVEVQSRAAAFDDDDYKLDVTNRLASAYYAAGDHGKAIELALENVDILREWVRTDPSVTNRLNLANQLNSAATYYREDEQQQNAIAMLTESNEVLETIPEDNRGNTDLFNLILLARLEDDRGNSQLAADYVAQSAVDLSRFRPGYARLYPLFTGAEIAGKLRDTALHDDYVRRMKAEYDTHPEKTDLSTLYVSVYEFQGHILAGRTDAALDAFEPVLELHETFYSESRAEEIAKLEADYDKSEREGEIAFLGSQAELDATRLRNQRLIQWLTMLAAAGGLFLVYTIFRRRNVRGRLDAKLDERTRIARDLHDGFLQNAYAASLFGSAAAAKIESPDVRKEVENSMRLMKVAMSEARASVTELDDPSYNVRLVEAVRTDLSLIENAFSRKTTLTEMGTRLRLPRSLKQVILGIVHEAAVNGCKHTQTGLVAVKLDWKWHRLNILIDDEGEGFEQGKVEEGFGMTNMGKLAESINASLQFQTTNVGGRVNLSVSIWQHRLNPARALRSWFGTPAKT